MKTVVIKPSATLVAQFTGELTAIEHEGKLYFPVMDVQSLLAESPKSASPAAGKLVKTTPTQESPVQESPAQEASAHSYTEDELMSMSVSELMNICTKMGIDPNAQKGRNTNKKLRTLILEGSQNPDDLRSKISSILLDIDSGKKNKPTALKAIMAVAPSSANEDTINRALSSFFKDESISVSEFTDTLLGLLQGVSERPANEEDSEETSEEDSKEEDDDEKSDSEEAEGEIIDPEELQVGDRVNVFWVEQGWFKGTVKSLTRGKVIVSYDDGTESALSETENPEVKLIEDK